MFVAHANTCLHARAILWSRQVMGGRYILSRLGPQRAGKTLTHPRRNRRPELIAKTSSNTNAAAQLSHTAALNASSADTRAATDAATADVMDIGNDEGGDEDSELLPDLPRTPSGGYAGDAVSSASTELNRARVSVLVSVRL